MFGVFLYGCISTSHCRLESGRWALRPPRLVSTNPRHPTVIGSDNYRIERQLYYTSP